MRDSVFCPLLLRLERRTIARMAILVALLILPLLATTLVMVRSYRR